MTEAGYVVRLDTFEGPLDLLIHLIRRDKIAMQDISITTIVRQYLQVIAQKVDNSLDQMSGFYNMAATLLWIKSRMVLSQSTDDGDEESSRDELVNQLIEYQRYKMLAELLIECQSAVGPILERTRDRPEFASPREEALRLDIGPEQLADIFREIMHPVTMPRLLSLTETVTIGEKLSLIEELFETEDSVPFAHLLRQSGSSVEIVCAFLAVLESARVRRLTIEQNRPFGAIRLKALGHV